MVLLLKEDSSLNSLCSMQVAPVRSGVEMAQSEDIEPDFQQQECILGLGLGLTDSAMTEGPQANNAAGARHCIMNQPRRLLALAV